ncbi:MAG: hypothetical protein IKR61_04560 [Lachnospiraceae bacterium]|nr:hypothetical protein [Lachnospiraceae bacterium]
MKANYDGTKAAQAEYFDNLIEGDRTEAAADLSQWQKPKAAMAIAVISTVLDFITLFTLFDYVFLQSVWIGLVMSFGIAVVLDTLPLVIAKFFHWAIYRTRRNAKLMLTVLLTGYFLLFLTTVGLRFAYKDMYGQETGSAELVNTSANTEFTAGEEEETEQGNPRSTASVLLLALSPLVTSIVTFGIAFASDDEVRRKYEYHKQRDHELDEALSDLDAAIETMDRDVQRDLDHDLELMRTGIEVIDAKRTLLKRLARHYLAEYLAESSATSRLSQEQIPDTNVTALPASNAETHELPESTDNLLRTINGSAEVA